jgi:hypothetical protein
MSTPGRCEDPIQPSVEAPYWRWQDGRRAGFREVSVSIAPARIAELDDQQVETVATLVRAGLRALRAGDETEARRLMSSASRLCAETVGQFPASGVEIDA